MTCTECLRLVATADVAELTTANAVMEHCHTCTDCATVIRDVADEARQVGNTLDGATPGVHPHILALRAVAGGTLGRRRAKRLRGAWYASAAVAALLAAVVMRRAPADVRFDGEPAMPVEARVVELHCLTPEQAVEVAKPQLPRGISAHTRPRLGLPVLTLRGTPGDVARAEQVIAQADDRFARRRPQLCASASALEPAEQTPRPGPARRGERPN